MTALSAEGSVRNLPANFIRRDGSVWPGIMSASEITLRGKPYILSSTKDVSELRQSQRNAIRANKSKSLFLANMSHELRTPMHAILSFSEFGADETASPELSELNTYFTGINASGHRLLDMLNDLLDLSKLESGKQSYHLQEVSVGALIDAIATELAPLLKQKELTLDRIVHNPSAALCCDQKTVLQVLRNLVANAIKFAPPESSITLETLAANLGDQAAITFRVSDRGPGVPVAELESIFDLFVQGSSASGVAMGTGLGLAICKEIVRAHHGTIRVDNRSGGGAQFSATFPQNGSTEKAHIPADHH